MSISYEEAVELLKNIETKEELSELIKNLDVYADGDKTILYSKLNDETKNNTPEDESPLLRLKNIENQ